MTREAFEHALDTDQLWTLLAGPKANKWYKCRRNGRTSTWKRDPSRFSIPIKYRFRDCTRVESEFFTNGLVDKWFHIGAEAPQ